MSTWIYRVSLNTALASDRASRRQKEARAGFQEQANLLNQTATPDPRLDWLYGRIEELSGVDRSLCLLLLDGFKYREISEILGISESNVGVKISRIKSTLSQKLEREKNDEL